MDAIFSSIDLVAVRGDAFAFLMAVLVISLVVTAVFYVSRLIFPQAGGGGSGGSHD